MKQMENIMHPEESQLYEHAGQRLTVPQGREMDRHLSGCPDCARRFAAIKGRRSWVGERFSSLAASEKDLPVNQARHRLAGRLQKQKEKTSVFKKPRSLAGAAIALVLMVALFAIPSVRAAAVNFLGLFRVQQIEVVSFNPANLPQDFEGRLVDFENLVSNTATFTSEGEPVMGIDQDQASELAGFAVRFPAGEQSFEASYQPAGQAEFVIDLALWQGLLESLGQPDVDFPPALDGETVTVLIPNSVTYLSGECAAAQPQTEQGMRFDRRTCTMLVQLPSPTIEAPPGLPLDRVGQAFLEILGLSAEEAEQFSRQIDWSTTLVVPVPQDADVREVSVNGVPATLFSGQHGPYSSYQLMWVQGGIVYALSMDGEYAAADVLAAAESLR
jgi:hypothetical protein